MKIMEPHVKTFLLGAESKALATLSSDNAINVVPVSSIRIEGEQVILVNYFMDKTFQNILDTGTVSLVAWSKMIGYQIKGNAQYETSGELFDRIVAWVAETIPGRVVKGIVIITPTDIYDIAPTKNSAEVLQAAQ